MGSGSYQIICTGLGNLDAICTLLYHALTLLIYIMEPEGQNG